MISADGSGNTLMSTSYCGWYEYMVFGEITGRSIIRRVAFSDILALAETCSAVKGFLRLDRIEKSNGLRSVLKAFKKKPLQLDAEIGFALAKIMLLFGVTATADASVISAFMLRLLQNWLFFVPADCFQVEVAIRSIISTLSRHNGYSGNQVLEAKLARCAGEAIERRSRDHDNKL
jgi:hypothetical protein